MTYKLLKKRIKENEGFSKKPYKDKLGKLTIGYGHLIKRNEEHLKNKHQTNKNLLDLFEKDFQKAVDEYKKNFVSNKFNKKKEALLIEMIFQLGIKNVLKFKRMIFNLKNKKKYLSAFEMMNSLWYEQTPKRVEILIKNYLE